MIAYSVTNGVASIELNRPRSLNAVVPGLVEELCLALETAAADGVRVAVLSGRGRAFCAGHDLKAASPHVDEVAHRRHLERVNDVTRLARRAPYLLISAVHGYALGNGAEFALAADVVVAATGAQFAFPEVSWGLSVTGGITHLIVNAVGVYRAKQLLFFGERFFADQAHAWGLVAKVTPEDRLLAEAHVMAATLAAKPRAALLRTKRLLDVVSEAGLSTAMAMETEQALVARQSEESREAISGFSKRQVRASEDGGRGVG